MFEKKKGVELVARGCGSDNTAGDFFPQGLLYPGEEEIFY